VTQTVQDQTGKDENPYPTKDAKEKFIRILLKEKNRVEIIEYKKEIRENIKKFQGNE
jgi:hypothetical protein